jgi:hypothetical protein
MKKKERITRYANKLFLELKPKLQGDVQADLVVYPAIGKHGAVVEVKLQRGSAPTSKGLKFEPPSPSVNYVLKRIPQHFFGGNIDAVQFSGTNISLEENRILVIKGDDQHWSESDAIADISRVLGAKRRETK